MGTKSRAVCTNRSDARQSPSHPGVFNHPEKRLPLPYKRPRDGLAACPKGEAPVSRRLGRHLSFRIRLGIRCKLGIPPETRYKHIHVVARAPTSLSAHGLRRNTQLPANCASLKDSAPTGCPQSDGTGLVKMSVLLNVLLRFWQAKMQNQPATKTGNHRADNDANSECGGLSKPAMFECQAADKQAHCESHTAYQRDAI